jgi:hypothetical protein
MADTATTSHEDDLRVAALLPVRSPAGRQYGEFEVAVRGFGHGGAELAGHLAGRVLAWDEKGRPGTSGLHLNVYPLGSWPAP